MIVETMDKDTVSSKIVLPLPYTRELWKELNFILEKIADLEQQYLTKYDEKA